MTAVDVPEAPIRGLAHPSPCSSSIRELARRRLTAHLAVIFFMWPLVTIAAASLEARRIPYYSISWIQAIAGASLGTMLLVADFLVVGLLLVAMSLAIFGRFGVSLGGGRTASWRRLCLEPMLLLLALACGVGIWYPTVLSQAGLLPFSPLPAWLMLALGVFVGGQLLYEVAPRRNRFRLAMVLIVLGALGPAPSSVTAATERLGPEPSDIVLFGLDSLAQTDDVVVVRQWVASQGGAWYEYPVAPGLLTNAVWASVLTMQPVSEHGIFHTFQQMAPEQALVLLAAKRAGYHTVAVFPDQLTCSVGADAGFDENRGGPVGWRQLLLPIVANSSVFLPIFKPVLPRLPWSATPPNHAGTFSYDLRRDIREILMSGDAGRRTLTAAHLTYLHSPAFPRLVDLSWSELSAVLQASIGALRDRSFDWQDVDREGDPVPVHRWKSARLQNVLTSELTATRFVERGGRLLVFSDHGDRAGLTSETFTEERFHRVILGTVGFPERALDTPISLVDVGALVGLVDTGVASDPVVDFAIAPSDLWPRLVATSRPHWSGAVSLDTALLKEVFAGLRTYRPWTTPGQATRSVE